MADYVKFLMRDGERWTELQPQLERNDRGNSHMPMLDTYLRMLSEFRRIMDSRKRGVRRLDYLLSLEELERIAMHGSTPPTGPRRADRAKGRPGSEGRSLLRRSVACCLVRSERHGLVAHASQNLEVA